MNDEQGALVDERALAGGRYGRLWDAYVDEWPDGKGRTGDFTWPGDEWGNPQGWVALFDRLFTSVTGWSHVIEIGPGSGKFTEMVLDRSAATVLGLDVSEKYLAVCADRCSPHVESGRLRLAAIDAGDPAFVLDHVMASGWRGQVDAFVSIDAMVHVDMQYLISYLIAAGAVLREGGELILTLANVTSEQGFAKLLRDIRIVGIRQASLDTPGRRFSPPGFEWTSPDLVQSVLERLGFGVDYMGLDGRDIELRAVLRDPTRCAELERFLRAR